MTILTVEWGEKIKQNRKQYRSVKHKVIITSHSLTSRVERPACPLKFTEEMAERPSPPQFPQNQPESRLTPSAPRGSSTFLSHWVLSKTNAAQPMELYSDECKSEAVLAAGTYASQPSCKLVNRENRGPVDSTLTEE